MVNAAEEFVYRVCSKSFLSLWSYANPLGKNSKELCDILVVCDPDIIIFSVKDIKPTQSQNPIVDWHRWLKRAIEDSCNQIYGAERRIKGAEHVIRSDGQPGLMIPKEPHRRIHRVAVALGGRGDMPLKFGDLGKGFVHVFDEISFELILRELDTISDFVQYLIDKEALCSAGVKPIIEGGEEDLLVTYLYRGRKFPLNFNRIVISSGLWATLTKRPEYLAKKREDAEYSYIWDRLIEIICNDILSNNLEFGFELSDNEMVVRQMARETRLSRRLLGKDFLEFVMASGRGEIRSRIMESLSDTAYVLLAAPTMEDRKGRLQELSLRCLVARGSKQNCRTVIGIATDPYSPGGGFSLDLFYLSEENWTGDDQQLMESVQRELGYFSSPRITSVVEDEYPSTSLASNSRDSDK